MSSFKTTRMIIGCYLDNLDEVNFDSKWVSEIVLREAIDRVQNDMDAWVAPEDRDFKTRILKELGL